MIEFANNKGPSKPGLGERDGGIHEPNGAKHSVDGARCVLHKGHRVRVGGVDVGSEARAYGSQYALIDALHHIGQARVDLRSSKKRQQRQGCVIAVSWISCNLCDCVIANVPGTSRLGEIPFQQQNFVALTELLLALHRTSHGSSLSRNTQAIRPAEKGGEARADRGEVNECKRTCKACRQEKAI